MEDDIKTVEFKPFRKGYMADIQRAAVPNLPATKRPPTHYLVYSLAGVKRKLIHQVENNNEFAIDVAHALAVTYTKTHDNAPAIVEAHHATRPKDHIGYKPETRTTKAIAQGEAHKPTTLIENHQAIERQMDIDKARVAEPKHNDNDYDCLTDTKAKDERKARIEASAAKYRKEQFWARVIA